MQVLGDPHPTEEPWGHPAVVRWMQSQMLVALKSQGWLSLDPKNQVALKDQGRSLLEH